MKEVYFNSDAEAEMIDTAQYYEQQQKELGKRFLISIQDGINRIQMNPLLYPVVHLDFLSASGRMDVPRTVQAVSAESGKGPTHRFPVPLGSPRRPRR